MFTRHDTSAIPREHAAILFGRLEHYKGMECWSKPASR